MDVEQHDDGAVSRIAAAIGEPARARMLCALLDNRARTSTELAMIGGVSPKIIDGDDWLNRRIRHLRDELATDLSEGERQAIEAELAMLSAERGLTPGGRRRSRLWRRLRGRLT